VSPTHDSPTTRPPARPPAEQALDVGLGTATERGAQVARVLREIERWERKPPAGKPQRGDHHSPELADRIRTLRDTVKASKQSPTCPTTRACRHRAAGTAGGRRVCRPRSATAAHVRQRPACLPRRRGTRRVQGTYSHPPGKGRARPRNRGHRIPEEGLVGPLLPYGLGAGRLVERVGNIAGSSRKPD
jgi:hypothetical protein